jgi:hypothetical protein
MGWVGAEVNAALRPVFTQLSLGIADAIARAEADLPSRGPEAVLRDLAARLHHYVDFSAATAGLDLNAPPAPARSADAGLARRREAQGVAGPGDARLAPVGAPWAPASQDRAAWPRDDQGPDQAHPTSPPVAERARSGDDVGDDAQPRWEDVDEADVPEDDRERTTADAAGHAADLGAPHWDNEPQDAVGQRCRHALLTGLWGGASAGPPVGVPSTTRVATHRPTLLCPDIDASVCTTAAPTVIPSSSRSGPVGADRTSARGFPRGRPTSDGPFTDRSATRTGSDLQRASWPR